MQSLQCVGPRLVGALVLLGSAVSCASALDPNEGHLDKEQEALTDEPGPICGGFAGLACPGLGDCADDPTDDCDPEAGGADCSGLCECNAGALVLCAPGTVFDSSPDVCACAPPASDPCDLVRCIEGTHCDSSSGQAQCVDDDAPSEDASCAAVTCLVGHDCVVEDGEAICVPQGEGCDEDYSE